MPKLKAKGIPTAVYYPKCLHEQPVFAGCESVGGAIAEDLFANGLCLPSGSSLSGADLERIAGVIRRACPAALASG